LTSDIRSVVYSLVPVCWLASDLRSVNSLVPVCWLTSELTDLSSQANQQTGTRELTDLRSEANYQTGTRELPTDLSSEVLTLLWQCFGLLVLLFSGVICVGLL
jgi:hypothetical protein